MSFRFHCLYKLQAVIEKAFKILTQALLLRNDSYVQIMAIYDFEVKLAKVTLLKWTVVFVLLPLGLGPVVRRLDKVIHRIKVIHCIDFV